jgi:hypothetical protein
VKAALLHSGYFTIGELSQHRQNNFESLSTDPQLNQD